MDKASAKLTVNGIKVKVAGGTTTSMRGNAQLARYRVSLVGIDRHTLDRPFDQVRGQRVNNVERDLFG